MDTPVRRPSLGMLLKRTKSGDLGKKAQALREAELERQRQEAKRVPPRLPEFANNSEQLSKSLGSRLQLEGSPLSSSPYNPQEMAAARVEHRRPYTNSAVAQPMPPPPPAFDPYARTESMTHRGRLSYASSAMSTLNSPRRVRRRKDPTPFNVLVIGTSSSGKTSFIDFLKTALALPPKKRAKKPEEDDFRLPAPATGNFVPHYLETEIDGERVGLTLWDSEGFEKNIVDLQLREMTAFIESKFEETFTEEMKVVRSPGVQDTHIHAVFLILDPAQLDRNLSKARKISSSLNGRQNGNHPNKTVLGALDPDLELQVLRSLHKKTTVIPVIAKADTVATKHMKILKQSVWSAIKSANLDPLETLGLEEDNLSDCIEEEESEGTTGSEHGPVDISTPVQESKFSPATSPNSKRLSSQSFLKHKAAQEDTGEEDEVPFLPLSSISPDPYEPNIIGRQFIWGFADPYNDQHCDFQRLKEAVFSEWRAELREASKEQWYEGWRTNKLNYRDRTYGGRI